MADKPDFTGLDYEALTAAISENKEKRAEIFALEDPSIAQVDDLESLIAAADDLAAEKAKRDVVAEEAGKRFAAAKAKFAAETGEPAAEEGDEDEDGDDEGDEDGDAEDGDADADADADADGDAEGEGDGEGVVTASVDHTKAQKIKPVSVAKRVGRKTNKAAGKAVQANTDVIITASAGVEGFETGQQVNGMEGVTKALFARAKGFPKHNAKAAKAVRAANGNTRQIEKKSLVSFGVDAPAALTASAGNDYAAVKNAIKGRDKTALMSSEEVLTAAGGWCAPSTPVYSYIADYVVDGLITVPEVSAPRGGLLLTTGPARSSQGAALDGFGFVQTEAEAEAGEEKDIETIVCPEFVDHRLDAIGYGVTIPLLTQKAYPELITDALRFAGVLYAHKVNQRVINDIVALADSRTFAGYGPSFTDALEALSLLAHKERRKWNLGDNAIMEVKLPQWVKEIFRADMSRRSAVAFDSVKDAQIAAHFTDRRLAVEYVSDWQELAGVNVVLPGTFDALLYPSGTVIKAVEDVINMSAIYDAASLTVNEYMGVFFEQGILVAKAGYGVSKITIPINTAGEMGALTLQGLGDASANGSF